MDRSESCSPVSAAQPGSQPGQFSASCLAEQHSAESPLPAQGHGWLVSLWDSEMLAFALAVGGD